MVRSLVNPSSQINERDATIAELQEQLEIQAQFIRELAEANARKNAIIDASKTSGTPQKTEPPKQRVIDITKPDMGSKMSGGPNMLVFHSRSALVHYCRANNVPKEKIEK